MAGCAAAPIRARSETSSPVAVLGEGASPFNADFNADDGRPRVLVLASPT
jgi:hypothetical protein